MADLKPKIKRHLLYTEDICKFSAFKQKKPWDQIMVMINQMN